LYTKDLDT